MPNRIRRAHTKSRFGCQQCKKRRIKVAIPSRHTLGLVRCPRAYTRFWSRHAYQVAPSAFSDVACLNGHLHFTHTIATDTEHSATLHASASGVPPCEVHAGSMGGSGRDMGGCGWATWEDVGRHGFVDGIRSPLHAISSGPQSSLSQCSSAFPRSLRKPVTCPCCKPPN